MIKRIVFVTVLSCISLWVRAQGAGSTAPAGANESSNVTLQGSAQDIYNIDLFTGTANIGIPIHSYSIDGLNLDVSLGYNTTGIRVDQGATSVGLGWALSAGGYIERTAAGTDDETTLPAFGNYPELRGTLVNRNNGSASYNDEYDLFTAVFAGRTIKFTFRFESGNVNVSTFPKSEIKLKVYYDGTTLMNGALSADIGTEVNNTVHYITFSIVDEKGNEFFFDRGDYEERNYDPTNVSNTPVIYYSTQRWVLTKIITYKGNEIDYEYNNYSNVSILQYKNEKVTEGNAYSYNNGSTTFSSPECLTVDQDELKYWNGNITHITKIIYPDKTTVTFNLETSSNSQRCDLANTYVLNSINISKEYDNNVKNSSTYKFNYAYFNSSGSEISYATPCSTIAAGFNVPAWPDAALRIRLKLKGIDKIGTDNTTTEPYYSFEYNDTIPERFSPSQDVYGYYNGKSTTPLTINNVTHYLSIPYHSFTLSTGTVSYGVDKTPDYTYTRAGILKKVKNGLGGSIELYYKAHSLYDAGVYNPSQSTFPPLPTFANYTNSFDGICLDKIIYKDGFSDDNTLTHKFLYSNGVRFFKDLYFWYPLLLEGLSNINFNSNGTSNPVNPGLIKRAWQNYYVNPVDFSMGANHGYSNVTVIKEGYQGAQLSKKEYTFSNIVENGVTKLNVHTGLMSFMTYPRMEFLTNEMGLPQVIKEYTGNTLTSETYNSYIYSENPGTDTRTQKSYDCLSNSILASYNIFDTWTMDVRTVPDYMGQHYYNFLRVGENYKYFNYEKPILTSSLLKVKSGNDYLQTTTSYIYDINDNVKSVWWTDSRGTTFHKDYTYVCDLGSLRQLVAAKSIWKKNSATDSVLVSYEETIPDNYPSARQFHTVKTAKMTEPQPNLNATSFTKDKEYVFDDKNNVIQTRFANTEQYDSYIWDTRFGLKTAEAKNAQYENIAYTSFESLDDPNASSYDRGGWTFDPGDVELASGTWQGKTMTGKYCYHVRNAGSSSITRTLQPGKEYFLSFWADANLTVTLGTTNVTMNRNTTTYGSWSLYNAYITVGSTAQTLTISSNVLPSRGYIDELRLIPAEASMTTYTYEPMFGISSICNERNDIIYIEYDAFGREWRRKDAAGNILSETRYSKQGSNN